MSAPAGTESLAVRIAELEREVSELRALVADIYRSNVHRDTAITQLHADANRALELLGWAK